MAIRGTDLKIGQVLYVVSDKTARIVPVVVSEQVSIVTLEGKSITWKVLVGSEQKRKVKDLTAIGGEKFASLAQAKESLLSRFEGFLEETLTRTQQEVRDWYHIELDQVRQQEEAVQQGTESKTDSTIDADDLFLDEGSAAPRPPRTSAAPIENIARQTIASRTDNRIMPGDSPVVRAAKMRASLIDDSISMDGKDIEPLDPNNLPPGVKMITDHNGDKIAVKLEEKS